MQPRDFPEADGLLTRSGFRLPVGLPEVLFVSQRDHGIDSRRPSRGKETR
jgi:hypothetical protein